MLGAILVVLVLVFVVVNNLGGNQDKGAADTNSGNTENAGATVDSDLVITKSDITDTVKFYPLTMGGTKMEVMAVKAPDGTIRTAFNTCQVCFDSGRGYYKQNGNEVICQNCGNRFEISQIEKIKGGCNPVPILEENKTEDDSTITVSKAILEEGKELFANWKK